MRQNILVKGYVVCVLQAVCSVHRLTYSEALGDVICGHGDKKLRITDTCLALAQMVYAACGLHRKAALTMCKRGLTFGAMEFIHQHKDFTDGEE